MTAALVVLGLLSWFWAFLQRVDRTHDGVDPYLSGSHPPPLVRLHLAFDIAGEFLKQQGWPAPSIQQVVSEALTNLGALATAKNWFAILDPARSFGDEAMGFVKGVRVIMGDAFREIEPTLTPYRFLSP